MKVMMTNVGNVDRLGLDRYQNFGLGTISASGTNTNQYLRQNKQPWVTNGVKLQMKQTCNNTSPHFYIHIFHHLGNHF